MPHRERQIIYDITCVRNLRKREAWVYIQNRNRSTDLENKYTVIKGEGWVAGKLRGWD